jgi:hypothetical protein
MLKHKKIIFASAAQKYDVIKSGSSKINALSVVVLFQERTPT